MSRDVIHISNLADRHFTGIRHTLGVALWEYTDLPAPWPPELRSSWQAVRFLGWAATKLVLYRSWLLASRSMKSCRKLFKPGRSAPPQGNDDYDPEIAYGDDFTAQGVSMDGGLDAAREKELSLVKEELRKAERQIEVLEQQVINLEQGQDFHARQGIVCPSQPKIAAQLDRVYNSLNSWAFQNFGERTAAALGPAFWEDIDQHLRQVTSDGLSRADIGRMGVSLSGLMLAIAANIIFTKIVNRPLDMCPPRLREQLDSDVSRHVISASPNGKEAQAWQAACLRVYSDKALTSAPSCFSEQEKQQSKDDHIARVCEGILAIAEPIGTTYCPKDYAIEKARAKLHKIAASACDPAMLLGTLASGHEVMDKQWIQRLRDEDGSHKLRDSRFDVRGVDGPEGRGRMDVADRD